MKLSVSPFGFAMAEDPIAAAAPPFTHTSGAALRFISFVNRTAHEPDHFLELDEGDVIWSPTAASDATTPSTSVSPPRGRSPSSSPPSSDCRRSRRAFAPEEFGLSAVLAESNGPTVRRRASLAVPPQPPRDSDGDGTPSLGQSAPVNVPTWTRRSRRQKCSFVVLGGEDVKEEDDDEEEEWVPPHVMVARSHVTTFSMFEGAGRTLKGRDLRRVRNAVWRQTGFLD